MPTQTYTPSATWHNTSQYQENGDSIDAPTAQDGGFAAQDNIAYLTGGNTSDAVSRIQVTTSVATLKLIGSSARRDRDTCMIEGSGVVYLFDSGSSATGDDYSVVTPATGTGRWILQANAVPESTSVRDIITGADLTAKGINITDVSYALYGGSRVVHPSGPEDIYGSFGSHFNSGDVLTSLDVYLAVTGGATISVLVEHYRYSGAGAPTRTTLATITTSGNTVLGTPVTWSKNDRIFVTATLDGSGGGAGDTAYLYWIAANATRSYIRE